MPVPVPRAPQLPAHQVHKHSKTEDAPKCHSSTFHHLKYTIPVSPTVSAPSVGSHDQWTNSLLTWRRTKTRHILEDNVNSTPEERGYLGYQQGLTSAVNARVIKGNHAEACLPPMKTVLSSYGVNPSSVQGSDDRWMCGAYMKSTGSTMLCHRSDDFSTQEYNWPQVDIAFAPILEDDSEDVINGDPGSSPIGPMTPFAEYVDHAVAAPDVTTLCDMSFKQEEIQSMYHDIQCYDATDHQYTDLTKQRPIAPVGESVQSASMKYKRFAEPMADWIVSYVWKVCNNCVILPPAVSKYSPSISTQRVPTAPMHLSAAVHSLLMSTLLQPSAILLALWYIARLPIYFGALQLSLEQVKERKFRAELLDTTSGIDGKTSEANATFRLIVLGCMLANKWLDDHTFSNKTWHTICKLPVHSLNKLESLALDIFSHDLRLSPAMWDQWLGHMLSYHLSLSPPSHTQPISRPSSNPQSTIQRVIQEIKEAPLVHSSSQPVFLSFEERSNHSLNLTETCDEAPSEAYDIDLDEDGPLREEYLPKRRMSNGSSTSQCPTSMPERSLRESKLSPNESTLPPPSKWSPAADEPIRRIGDRPALYMPVQPSIAPLYPNSAPAMCWAPAVTYVAIKQCPGYPGASSKSAAPSNDCFYSQSTNTPSRPRPYCNASAFSPPNSGLWYPQIGSHYRTGDVQMSFDGMGYTSQSLAIWPSAEPYGPTHAPRVLFGPYPPINYSASWIPA